MKECCIQLNQKSQLKSCHFKAIKWVEKHGRLHEILPFVNSNYPANVNDVFSGFHSSFTMNSMSVWRCILNWGYTNPPPRLYTTWGGGLYTNPPPRLWALVECSITVLHLTKACNFRISAKYCSVLCKICRIKHCSTLQRSANESFPWSFMQEEILISLFVF